MHDKHYDRKKNYNSVYLLSIASETFNVPSAH